MGGWVRLRAVGLSLDVPIAIYTKDISPRRGRSFYRPSRDSPEKNQRLDPCEAGRLVAVGTSLGVRGSSGCRGLVWAIDR
jgi:hypothetical protein